MPNSTTATLADWREEVRTFTADFRDHLESVRQRCDAAPRPVERRQRHVDLPERKAAILQQPEEPAQGPAYPELEEPNTEADRLALLKQSLAQRIAASSTHKRDSQQVE